VTDEQRETVEQHMNLAHYVAHKFKYYKGIEYEDIAQIAMVGLCKAVAMFDQSRGVKFATFAVPVMLHEILMYSRKKRHYTYSLDAEFTNAKGETRRLCDTIPFNQDFDGIMSSRDVMAAINSLHKRQKQIVMLKCEGKTQRDIAARLDLSQTTVSRVLVTAENDIRRALG
jgi:RNA polymerase sigma factor (sigma-70 family)